MLVRIWPEASRTLPDPVPPVVPERALIVTTLGEAFCAAAVTGLTLSGLLMTTGVYWVV